MIFILGGVVLLLLGAILVTLAIGRPNRGAEKSSLPGADWLGGIPSTNGPPRTVGPAEAVEALQQGRQDVRWDPKTRKMLDDDA
jgi:hypothetical protein